MNKSKLLIVEGNTNEENFNFDAAGCIPQSENFKLHVKKIDPSYDIDIVQPGDDKSISKIISSLKKYNGIILTGSTLRINDDSNEVKKHIQFAKKCFESEQKIFAACWGLQITVIAAGGRCRVSPNGAHIGIAQDIELTDEGKKHKLYLSKQYKFSTPAFNYDEVEIPPKNSILLASDRINKIMALHFDIGKSEVWGLQYHPEIPYDYMIKLIKHRSNSLIEKNFFKDINNVHSHIKIIEKAEIELKDDIRTLELKNWLNYIKK
ncbi:MAG TPA: type 1 glutamine amidotransferase [Candidatus Pelagibacter sp.]|jgi:GMP synthase (glutamine-hydrolysing)|nr:type 1 glutamine amidotransferase [Candidatus Pelagibacter sp.]